MFLPEYQISINKSDREKCIIKVAVSRAFDFSGFMESLHTDCEETTNETIGDAVGESHLTTFKHFFDVVVND